MLDTRKNVERHYYNVKKKEQEKPAWDTDFEELEQLPPKEEFLRYDKVVFVQGLPQLDTASAEHTKLKNELMGHFESYGEWDEDSYFHSYKVDSEGNTKSLPFCFIEFKHVSSAEAFMDEMNGYVMRYDGAEHKITTSSIDVFDGPSKLKYEETKRDDFTKWSNFKTWWLLEDAKDYQFRDQYVVRYRQGTGDKVKEQCDVFWNDVLRKGRVQTSAGKREMEEGRHMTGSKVCWSPRGTYLATFHNEGILLWAGSDWSTCARFGHKNVSFIQFSPMENFFISYSMDIAVDEVAERNPRNKKKEKTRKTKKKASKAIIIWDILAQKSRRPLEAEWSFEYGKWPIFKWSYDDSYFARMGSSKWPDNPREVMPDGLLYSDKLTIFESKTMKKLTKRSFSIPHILDFAWRPSKANMLVYVTREVDMGKDQIHSAAIFINRVKDTGLEQIRKKRIFKVDNTGIEMYWHPEGDYVAVKVSHYVSLKKFNRSEEVNKTLYHDIELVVLNSKSAPVTNVGLDFATAGPIAWEPGDSGRFAVFVSHPDRVPAVRLFKVQNEQVLQLYRIPTKTSNHISWSPLGRYLMIASYHDAEKEILTKDWSHNGRSGSNTGSLEFYDVNTKTSLNQTAHPSMTGLHWSPCGRYVVSSVCQEYSKTSHSEASDCGYTLWNFQGEQIATFPYNQFLQFCWRPRPPSLLDPGTIKEIRERKYKEHRYRFQQIDHQITQERASDEQKQRKQERDWWKELSANLKDWAEEINKSIVEAHGEADSDAYVFTVETVEETIEATKTPVSEAQIKKVLEEALENTD